MNGMEFARFRSEAKELLEEAVQSLAAHPRRDGTWNEAIGNAQRLVNDEARLRVVLTGEFNAGKSSMISALTGEEVGISAKPETTREQEFEWRGINIVDTPGVQSDRDSVEHDEIARRATVNADLVIFVLTNELFNDRLARYFHFLAGPAGLGLAPKMAVVVNKMDRETNRDETIQTEVYKVIDPYQDVPVLLAAVKSLLDSQGAPAHLAERLRAESRVPELIARLDAFVRGRGTAGKLTRPLQLLEEVLDRARERMAETDSSSRAMELLRRKRRVLQKAEEEFDRAVRLAESETKQVVLGQADATVKMVGESSSSEEIEAAFAGALERVQPKVDEILAKLGGELEAVMLKSKEKLEELDASTLGAAVRFDAQREQKVVELKDLPGEPSKRSAHAKSVKSVLQGPVKEGLESAAKNAKNIGNAVKDVGKAAFKMKFRPWQAANIGKGAAKWAGRMGKAVPFLAAAFDFYITQREEREAAERAQALALTRLAVYRGFREQANQEAESVRVACNTYRKGSLGAQIEAVEKDITAQAGSTASEKALVEKWGEMLARSRALRAAVQQSGGPATGAAASAG